MSTRQKAQLMPPAATDCGQTLDAPCRLNEIGDRQIGFGCKRHTHRSCSGFVGDYDTYLCLCRCHFNGKAQE